MNFLDVQKARESTETTLPIFAQIENLFDTIRRRAFDLFAERGYTPGRDMDDWLQAENELIWSVQADVVETATDFRFRLEIPGLENTPSVAALPDAILIYARSSHGKTLYRRFDLPDPIDVDRVKATLNKGVLSVTAVKSVQTDSKHAVAGQG